uniref:N-acetyltransferase domain-containing protein n=1 Tax=Chromera velia CCMP2878 TaxID=1169474 RepID=A0A0G4I9U4_9ALVE|mmetsp:Transcript_10955/g.21208  ORF Transcript_10955/g.21208 Transcript_10955/m.21208 type:complete len:208 (+) Transcript_10955:97-720(+)|eukprot:Cvel_12348.t1-p1 / transcript=Cvel_12348.t1 / gene=Cvel_12348 / organism=Chromera_velia_CCMP2878 / gene_product=N-alpha-acetyltransferase 50, putative / transcript_product=N-alpha-acetyltransferase 50, putative / location=Cvel_scaffold803:49304-51658(+) / protein_length=207 / sequence_SO=supercontig / SO=protein_coding / is_pseudo=false
MDEPRGYGEERKETGPELPLEFGQFTEKNIEVLRKLNLATFPVNYHDTFYKALPRHFPFCQMALLKDVCIGAICARLELASAVNAQLLDESAEMVNGGGVGGDGKKIHPEACRLYIMTLSVLQPYRRGKSASKLLEWLLQRAQEKKDQDLIVDVFLHVHTINEPALKFYQRHGFSIIAKLPNYYPKLDPPSCYVLSRPLDSKGKDAA